MQLKWTHGFTHPRQPADNCCVCSNVLQLSHCLHNSCDLSELPVKVLQAKERNPTMKAAITQTHRVHSNKCRPGTVEWSSQKTFDKSVQKFQQTSTAVSRKGSWEIDTCQSLTPFQVSTGCPRSTEKNYKPCCHFFPKSIRKCLKMSKRKKKKALMSSTYLIDAEHGLGLLLSTN